MRACGLKARVESSGGEAEGKWKGRRSGASWASCVEQEAQQLWRGEVVCKAGGMWMSNREMSLTVCLGEVVQRSWRNERVPSWSAAADRKGGEPITARSLDAIPLWA